MFRLKTAPVNLYKHQAAFLLPFVCLFGARARVCVCVFWGGGGWGMRSKMRNELLQKDFN